MKALCWHGKSDVRVDNVPDPVIKDSRDAIIKVTSTAICGSDLHLFDGFMPTMESGDILGHEFMGEVVELGSAVTNLRKGDRVVVPFTMACGSCFFCQRSLTSCCDNSNPNHEMAEKVMGHSPSGLFGYSHMLGGFSGGQAEYVRVPFADVGPYKVPDGLPDDKVLFLTDIFPTGYMAAEQADIEPGETVAVWGCGPVGQFSIQSAWKFGAGRVIAIDTVPERLRMAERLGKAETIDFMDVDDVYEKLQELTNGRGPDRCIDAVGSESHGFANIPAMVDKVKAAVGLGTDRPNALRQAIIACRKGGTVSVPGVYSMVDNMPMGAFINKSLVMKTGQTHVHRYFKPLMEMIEKNEIDPAAIITHRLPLSEAPAAYKKFRDKEDGCIKVVLKP